MIGYAGRPRASGRAPPYFGEPGVPPCCGACAGTPPRARASPDSSSFFAKVLSGVARGERWENARSPPCCGRPEACPSRSSSSPDRTSATSGKRAEADRRRGRRRTPPRDRRLWSVAGGREVMTGVRPMSRSSPLSMQPRKRAEEAQREAVIAAGRIPRASSSSPSRPAGAMNPPVRRPGARDIDAAPTGSLWAPTPSIRRRLAVRREREGPRTGGASRPEDDVKELSPPCAHSARDRVLAPQTRRGGGGRAAAIAGSSFA
jgi:hypothetical protein